MWLAITISYIQRAVIGHSELAKILCLSDIGVLLREIFLECIWGVKCWSAQDRINFPDRITKNKMYLLTFLAWTSGSGNLTNSYRSTLHWGRASWLPYSTDFIFVFVSISWQISVRNAEVTGVGCSPYGLLSKYCALRPFGPRRSGWFSSESPSPSQIFCHCNDSSWTQAVIQMSIILNEEIRRGIGDRKIEYE